MSQTHAAQSAPGARPGALGATIAKWFIPSATALFVVVGYIVQTAQEDLLGVGAISHSSASYVDASALFFRDLVSLPLDVLLGDAGSLASHWRVLLLVGLGLACLLSARSLAASRPRASGWLAAGVLLALALAKFFAFDAPLTLVNNMILGGDSGYERLINPNDAPVAPPGAEGPIHKDAAARAHRFAFTIVCSHLGDGALAVHPEVTRGDKTAGGGECAKTDLAGRAAAPRAAFTAIVFLELGVVLASFLILRHGATTHGLAMLALLGLCSTLTVPYDYGKLLKSTAFEYGVVKLSTALGGNDGVGAGDALTTVPGLVLAHDASGTRLLHLNPDGQCPLPSTTMRQRINMLSLGGSEVVSIGEIESRDIFEWSVSSRPKC